MSKVGRRPIDIAGITVEVAGNEVHYKGPKRSGVYQLPAVLDATIEGSRLIVGVQKAAIGSKKVARDVNRVWGLHRVLLCNAITGSTKDFVQQLRIVGLGYKVVVSSEKLNFSLGYSHKIDFILPKGVSAEVDKTGQLLTLKSTDKLLVGQVASDIKRLRLPEPYKGTGIRNADKEVRRKAGKTKSS